MTIEKKSGNQGFYCRCAHCKKRFRSWNALWKHWRMYCSLAPKGLPSEVVCEVKSTWCVEGSNKIFRL